MFVAGNLLYSVAVILDYVLSIASWLVIIRALISWVNPDPLNPIVRILHNLTEPILAPFRRILPSYSVGLDISPIFAIMAIWFLKLFIVRTLFGIAARLG